MGVSEISKKLDLDPATVCRILLTLKDKGLVYCSPITHKYTIGPKILRLAQIGIGDGHLRSRALPHMRRLRDQTGETVALSLRIGFERTFIEQVEGTHELKHTIQVGRISPLHCGAAGKILLAYLPDKEIDQYLASPQLIRLTDTTINDPPRLRAEIQQIRQQGFAVSLGEVHSWGVGVAGPIYDHTGQVLASLNIAMPRVRYDPGTLPDLIAATTEATQHVSAELGYS